MKLHNYIYRYQKFGRASGIFCRILAGILAASMLLFALVGCKDEPAVTTPDNSDGDKPVGGTPKKQVAITFDDGPQHYEERTKKIVDELSKYGFTATFFVVGNRVAGGDALAYAVEKGNEIGIHGYTHENYYDKCNDEVYENEISKTLAAIRRQIPNYEVKLLRPIGGRITPERAAASPYSVIMWSVDSDDWGNKYQSGDSDEVAAQKVDTIVNNVMTGLEHGDIILLHDIYESTYDATVLLLKRLYEEGYEVVSVSELLGDSLAPGKIYNSLYSVE